MSAETLYDPHNHLWFRRNEDGTVSVGATKSILSVLGAPSFIRLPEAGKAFAADEAIGSLETDKTAFAIALSFAGTVVDAFPPTDVASLPAAEDGETPLFSVRPATAEWTGGLVGAADYVALSAP